MSFLIRRYFILLHRYIGLAMTLFLIIVGLTGSLLAFQPELNRILTPQLFPAVRDGQPLELGKLAKRAEQIAPEAQINLIDIGAPETAVIRVEPRYSPGQTKPATLEFSELFLDPISGDELGRRFTGDGLPSGLDNLMPFVFRLHYNLSLTEIGEYVLGIIALLWTIDCFVSFCLTLPNSQRFSRSESKFPQRSFWARWKPAWLIKWRASTYRVNYDLHRAGSLWIWLALLVYAWSSVYMNLHDSVYAPATRAILDYPAPYWELPRQKNKLEQPAMDWSRAIATAEGLMAEQSKLHGFTVEKPIAMRLDRSRHIYIYTVRSDRDIQDRRGRTRLVLDANTGELRQLQLPTGQYNGITVTMWLNALHDANVFGLPYRLFVSVLGLLIVMLASTGVYIWWKKRQARNLKKT